MTTTIEGVTGLPAEAQGAKGGIGIREFATKYGIGASKVDAWVKAGKVSVVQEPAHRGAKRLINEAEALAVLRTSKTYRPRRPKENQNGGANHLLPGQPLPPPQAPRAAPPTSAGSQGSASTLADPCVRFCPHCGAPVKHQV